MIDKFKLKLTTDGRSFKWFCDKYLSGKPYGTIISQLNGFTKPCPELMEAIKKYLGE